ncbi:metallothionein [Rhizosaccharibacter radicis]|uniref:Metallothionein n=1 Tax=Rhizosaccharibacter radicis TaxID=2782605 RepID=A0ABT1VSH3_9PROT|nr:metallothionein [Acetobacteraceae bacterium KSS12]
MISVAVEQAKCACPDRVGIVDISRGIRQVGRICCDDACAGHHEDGAGCHHAGCTCHG